MARIDRDAKQVDASLLFFGPPEAGRYRALQVLPELLAAGTFDPPAARDGDKRILQVHWRPQHRSFVPDHEVTFDLVSWSSGLNGEELRALIEGADGFLFIVDSTREALAANRKALRSIEVVLQSQGRAFSRAPIVFLYNKRDLKTALPIRELQAKLNSYGFSHLAGSAIEGTGVREALFRLADAVGDTLLAQALGSAPVPEDEIDEDDRTVLNGGGTSAKPVGLRVSGASTSLDPAPQEHENPFAAAAPPPRVEAVPEVREPRAPEEPLPPPPPSKPQPERASRSPGRSRSPLFHSGSLSATGPLPKPPPGGEPAPPHTGASDGLARRRPAPPHGPGSGSQPAAKPRTPPRRPSGGVKPPTPPHGTSGGVKPPIPPHGTAGGVKPAAKPPTPDRRASSGTRSAARPPAPHRGPGSGSQPAVKRSPADRQPAEPRPVAPQDAEPSPKESKRAGAGTSWDARVLKEGRKIRVSVGDLPGRTFKRVGAGYANGPRSALLPIQTTDAKSLEREELVLELRLQEAEAPVLPAPPPAPVPGPAPGATVPRWLFLVTLALLVLALAVVALLLAG